MKRKNGYMLFETFQTIMDELGDTLLYVVLYSWGEPFLNKNTARMIEACTARNITTVVDTNGHCLQTLSEALSIVDSGLDGIIIALDGSTQEIYQSYRIQGDVEKVKRSTLLLEEAKRLRGSPYPYIHLRVVVTRDNEMDLFNLERFALEAGVNMLSLKSVGMTVETKNYSQYETKNETFRRFEYEGTTRQRRPPFKCGYLFRFPTVFWDGTLVGCEYDYDLEVPLGKIGEKPFAEMWNSPEAIRMRQSNNSGYNRPDYCNRCPYRDRVHPSTVFSAKELRPPHSTIKSGKRSVQKMLSRK